MTALPYNLLSRCLGSIRREMTRNMVRGDTPGERHDHWRQLQEDPETQLAAKCKLRAMDNLELLELIAEALASD